MSTPAFQEDSGVGTESQPAACGGTRNANGPQEDSRVGTESQSAQREEQAARLLTVEMISGLLASVGPHELSQKLAEQLRELTGARTVLLLGYRDGQPELLHACPARRMTLFSTAELASFFPQHTPGPLPLRTEELALDHPLHAILSRAGVQSLLRFPLCAGGELLAVLVVLDLPTLERIEDAIAAITLLCPPMALALRNAFSHEQIEQQNRALQAEILQRRRAEADLQRNGQLLEAINRVLHDALAAQSEAALANRCLDAAQRLTGAKFGFIGELNGCGRLDTISLSPPAWEACRVPATTVPRLVTNMIVRGIWGRVLQDGRPVLTNDPATHPDRVGTPPGHPVLTSFLGVPLTFGRHTIGLIALGNKPEGFEARDQTDLEALAIAFAEALTRRRLDDELNRHAAALEAANQELEAFSYSVSHDLRSPLRAVDGYARILTEDHAARLGPEGQRVLGVICAEARRMGQLIDNLLAFSRLNRQALQGTEINMGALAQAVCEQCAAQAAGRQIQFKLHPLPVAHGDPAMLRQALTNLVSNAVKYTGPKANAEIELGSRVERGHVCYYVKDNGVGFDMRYVEKLFGVFQRLHSEAEFEGTGVGLALVQRIVHRHGGRVWAEGQLNEGATFYFTLPNRQDSP